MVKLKDVLTQNNSFQYGNSKVGPKNLTTTVNKPPIKHDQVKSPTAPDPAQIKPKTKPRPKSKQPKVLAKKAESSTRTNVSQGLTTRIKPRINMAILNKTGQKVMLQVNNT